jgi:hypothetical protein
LCRLLSVLLEEGDISSRARLLVAPMFAHENCITKKLDRTEKANDAIPSNFSIASGAAAAHSRGPYIKQYNKKKRGVLLSSFKSLANNQRRFA